MRHRRFLLGFAAVTLLLAGAASTFASSSPDGLERVAREQGIARTEQSHALGHGPMADYDVEAVGDGALSGGLAGVTGVLVVLALTTGLAFAVRRRNATARGR
jgi:cobalt/nickel transport protein